MEILILLFILGAMLRRDAPPPPPPPPQPTPVPFSTLTHVIFALSATVVILATYFYNTSF